MPSKKAKMTQSDTTEPLHPAETSPMIEGGQQAPPIAKKDDAPPAGGKTELKKELGLIEGCAIILGIIIGSGIFISPVGVLERTGSTGMSLVVWVSCGVLSMIGAICYAELGTAIPKSGGDYAYIGEAFGPFLSFLFLWDANLIFVPTTNAIMALTFANYVIKPFFPGCDMPDASIRLLAALSICFLTFINCWNVRYTTKLQNFFMVTKVGALLMVIVAGIVSIFNAGTLDKFDNISFKGTTDVPGEIAASFYSGIFSYAGWNYLNFMTEELKNPFKNLPRAIYISLPLVTAIYVLTNVAYLAVLTPQEMKASNAIAVTFADKAFGTNYSWIITILVALAAFGGLSVHIMTSARICFVGAREGQFPGCLATINVGCNTPLPSLLFLGFLSLVYLCTTDIFALIEYTSFIESSFILCSIAGLLFMRWKRPDMKRPIKVNIIVPIVFLAICGFLVIMPMYVRPIEVGMGVLITATGIPAYFLFVYWKNKPKFLQSKLDSLTIVVQKLTLSIRDDKEE